MLVSLLQGIALYATFAYAAGGWLSPPYPNLFSVPLPIPQTLNPKTTYKDPKSGQKYSFYEVTLKNTQLKTYPNLPPTTYLGYNGQIPGPVIRVPAGHMSVLRVVNSGPRVSSTHLHGATSRAVFDGWAEDTTPPGHYKDYFYSNKQSARTLWYHDHALRHTGRNVYEGLVGLYIIEDGNPHKLPSGKYDIPLVIADRLFGKNGQLIYANSMTHMGGAEIGRRSLDNSTLARRQSMNMGGMNMGGMNMGGGTKKVGTKQPAAGGMMGGNMADMMGSMGNMYADVITVNGQPWPKLNVEPRKYRFRILNTAVSRPFNLYLSTDGKNSRKVDMVVVGTDAGLTSHPVGTPSLAVTMGERYEVVIDFAPFKGQSLTLLNEGGFQSQKAYEETGKVMRFHVGGKTSSNANNGPLPKTLTRLALPATVNRVDRSFAFDFTGGRWLINNVGFQDLKNRILARPKKGSTERWRFINRSQTWAHAIHVHLVEFQIVSRSGGRNTLMRYETAGLKDVVALGPGETVDVVAKFLPWEGTYMFHCHNLIHEDDDMMDAFTVDALKKGAGSDSALNDPLNAQYRAKPFKGTKMDVVMKVTLPEFSTLDAYSDTEINWSGTNSTDTSDSETTAEDKEPVKAQDEAPSPVSESSSPEQTVSRDVTTVENSTAPDDSSAQPSASSKTDKPATKPKMLIGGHRVMNTGGRVSKSWLLYAITLPVIGLII